MKLWRNCEADIFDYDGNVQTNEPYEVKFNGDKIVVSYKDDDGGYTVGEGQQNGKGHFFLKAESVKGRATLHMLDEEEILEGFWEEDGEEAMWRGRDASLLRQLPDRQFRGFQHPAHHRLFTFHGVLRRHG